MNDPHDNLIWELLDEVDKWITDGFGNTWSSTCLKCGKKTMEIVRPGKVQCSNCE